MLSSGAQTSAKWMRSLSHIIFASCFNTNPEH